jgi:hypothetical protein
MQEQKYKSDHRIFRNSYINSPPRIYLIVSILLVLALFHLQGNKVFNRRMPTESFSTFSLVGHSGYTKAQIKAMQEVTPNLVALFKPGTPVASIFNACVHPCGSMPDMAAFDAYRKYAADPARYEDSVCRLYGRGSIDADETARVVPVRKFNRKTTSCEVSNWTEVRRDNEAYNNGFFVQILPAIPVLLWIIGGFFWMRPYYETFGFGDRPQAAVKRFRKPQDPK